MGENVDGSEVDPGAPETQATPESPESREAQGISGTEWMVQELGGEVTAPPKPQLAFGSDGRLTGRTGVNRIMGEYAVRDGLLVIGNAATTRMAGPPEAMAQEQRLLEVLASPQPFVITGDRLEIGDGETLALLVRPSVRPVPGEGTATPTPDGDA